MISRRCSLSCLALLSLILVAFQGCGSSPLPPPITISIRNSILDESSKVIRITNDSQHHLYNISVVGRNFKDVSSASVRASNELRPGATVEVGWLEFGNWIPRSGESVEVYADNYGLPKIHLIP